MKCSSLWIGSFLLAAAGQVAAAPTACVASSGTNCPARIPDAPQAALVSTVEVPALVCPGTQALLSISVAITHGSVGDLTLSVQNPGGESVTLLSNVQGASGPCRGSDLNAVFADGGGSPICSTYIASVGGTISAEAPLAPLVAASPEGTWTLTIADDSNSGDGALNDWSVDVECAPPPTADPVSAPLSWQALLAIVTLLAFTALGALRRRQSAR